MRPIRNLTIYFGVTYLGGAMLAPWLHALAGWLAPHADWIAELAQKPFHRYVNRAVLFMALAGLWPFLRSLEAHSWRALGLAPMDRVGTRWCQGFAIGFASLAIVALLVLFSGARVLKTYYTTADIADKFAGAALTALVVGLVEEVLFRGTLFGAIRRSHHWAVAMAVSSLIYSVLHFFQKPPSPAEVHWYSGLLTFAHMMRGLVDPGLLLPGLLSLAMAGMILAYGYHTTNSLYFSIGLHTGWVFWLKSWGGVTMDAAGTGEWFWGSGKLYDGWLAFLVLTAVLAACMVLFKRSHHGREPAI